MVLLWLLDVAMLKSRTKRATIAAIALMSATEDDTVAGWGEAKDVVDVHAEDIIDDKHNDVHVEKDDAEAVAAATAVMVLEFFLRLCKTSSDILWDGGDDGKKWLLILFLDSLAIK